MGVTGGSCPRYGGVCLLYSYCFIRIALVVLRTGQNEWPALKIAGVIGRRPDATKRKMFGKRIGAVARDKAKMSCLAVVPPVDAVGRHAVDDGVANPRRQQRAAHQDRKSTRL